MSPRSRPQRASRGLSDDPVVAAARARAAADVALGIENLKEQYRHSSVYKESFRVDGRTRQLEPEREMLAGSLRRLGIDPDTVEGCVWR